jgi:hypothetical protein
MALSATLEAMVAELEKVDPVAGKEQRALLEKYPSLQKPTEEQRLRQADYDRKHNEDKQKIEYGTTMKKWADDNIPKYDAAVAEAAEAAKQRDIALAAQKKAEAALQEKITKSATESGVDPEALAAAVKAKLGSEYFTKAEFETALKTGTDKLVEDKVKGATDRFYANDVPRLAGLNAAVTEGQNRFFEEFKDHLDPEAYVAHLSAAGDKFMTDGKFDRKKAYDAFVVQKRSEVSRSAEIEKEAQKRADAILAERGGQGSFPGTSGPPGPLQVRFNAKDKSDPLFGAAMELGDNSAAAAAAAELHLEGK